MNAQDILFPAMFNMKLRITLVLFGAACRMIRGIILWCHLCPEKFSLGWISSRLKLYGQRITTDPAAASAGNWSFKQLAGGSSDCDKGDPTLTGSLKMRHSHNRNLVVSAIFLIGFWTCSDSLFSEVKTYGHPYELEFKDMIPLWKAEKFDPEAEALLKTFADWKENIILREVSGEAYRKEGVELLGSFEKLTWKQTGQALRIQLPYFSSNVMVPVLKIIWK